VESVTPGRPQGPVVNLKKNQRGRQWRKFRAQAASNAPEWGWKKPEGDLPPPPYNEMPSKIPNYKGLLITERPHTIPNLSLIKSQICYTLIGHTIPIPKPLKTARH